MKQFKTIIDSNLLFILILIIIFLTLRPSKQRAMEDLKIDSEQIDKVTFEP